MEPLIKVSSLAKKYRIYDSPGKRLWELLHHGNKILHQEFWALDDISFALNKGESLGIIGVNGSGKSTLLQIICGVLQPSRGSCLVLGRVTALLELGTGFSFESTGLDNVMLQGAVYGYSRGEVMELLPMIEEFADIGGFFNRPVKQYSSGMLVRLAVAIAFNLKPDILVVDEALAVGDIFFQAKCINKLQEMRRAGVTLLFVSHDMGTIRTLCDRAILLDQGRLEYQGEPSRAIEEYHALRAKHLGAVDLARPVPVKDRPPAPPNQEESFADRAPDKEETPKAEEVSQAQRRHYGNGKGKIVFYAINKKNLCPEVVVDSGGMLEVDMEIQFTEAVGNPFAAIMLRTWQGTELYGNNTTFANTPLNPVRQGDRFRIKFRQKTHLNNGQYLLTLALAEWGEGGEVVFVDRRLNDVLIIVQNGPFPYAGFCNMEGEVRVEPV